MSNDIPPKYKIQATNRYKKHLKLIAKRNLDNIKKINAVVHLLERGLELPEKMKDHVLVGNWTGHRKCHVGPDLLLIYKIEEDVLILELVDTGTHADVFGV